MKNLPASGAPGDLLDRMPVYRSRIANAQGMLESATQVELNDFFMHDDAESVLDLAARHFDSCLSVLDLGCGFGASVLWLAHRSEELRALAGVDLSEDSIFVARALAKRVLPDDFRSSFFVHDIAALTEDSLGRGCGLDQVDAVLSLNVGVHLSEQQRRDTWQFVGGVLSAQGRVFVQDFYRLRETDEAEDRLLEEQLACSYLPGISEYVDDLDNAITHATIIPEDVTQAYAAGAQERYERYAGDDVIKREFYRAMNVLLGSGAIGGLRITLSRD